MLDALEAKDGQAYKWLVCAATTIGAFMSLLDTTAVNIALPPIMMNFGTDVETGQWVLTAYMLAMAVVMPTTGYLAERLGSKRLYLLVLAGFTTASLLCGLAWSIESLIVFRTLQGLSGGMLQPLGMSIVLQVIRVEERGNFMAVLALPTLLAPILGPTAGGYLVDAISWRTIFMMNVPIGAVAIFACLIILRETPLRRNLTFDALGFLLSSLGFSTTLLGFAYGPDNGWTSTEVVSLLGCGLACLVLWVIAELRARDPMLDLRLFANRVYTVSVFGMWLLMLGLFSFGFVMSIFLQQVRQLDPFQAGLILFPQAIFSFISMNVAGKLYNRLGPRPLILVGFSLLSLATWLMTSLSVDTSDRAITLIMIVRGFSMGFLMMPLQTTALNAVPRERMARGTALTNVSQRVVSSFATALLATVLQQRENFHYAILTERVTAAPGAATAFLLRAQQDFLHMGMSAAQAQRATLAVLSRQAHQAAAALAFDDAFRVMFGCCLLGFVLVVLIPGREQVQRVAHAADGARPVTLPRMAREPELEPAAAAAED